MIDQHPCRSQKTVRFPPPPVSFELFTSDHSSFNARLSALEQMTTDICDRVVHVEAMFPHLATKNDITTVEATLLKWFIGTAIALTSVVTGVVFAAAKLFH